MENSNFPWNPNRHVHFTREHHHPKPPSPWNPNPNRYGRGEEKPRPPRSWNPNTNPNRDGHFSREEKPKPRPKVVSIPVHFVEPVAKAKRKDSAAMKIQKLLRGFLVRKKVRIVKEIEAEIGEIERRVESGKDLIRNNEKERMRVNEMLMKMLLRLDSVSGVRDFRRKVILKAISLQDRVDALVSGEIAMADDQTLEIPQAGAEDGIKLVSFVEETLEFPTITNRETPKEEESLFKDDGVSWMEEEDWSILEAEKGNSEGSSGGAKSSRERMALENQSLKGLVVELRKRSVLQCGIMRGLAKRVEELEKSVAAMEERRKKKREASSALASEKSKCCYCHSKTVH